MGDTTGIEWSDKTFNPWIGCQKVSPGCTHCYAEKLVNGRMGGDFRDVHRTRPENWDNPRRWSRELGSGETSLVFSASLSDIFLAEADAWRPDLWALIRETPNLTWQILTKRPERIRENLPPDWGPGYENVWLGTSVETQEYADRRIPELAAVPAALKFLSCEPLLGPLNLRPYLNAAGAWGGIAWVITGGESGTGYRPMLEAWALGVRDACVAAEVPFFFKQWGGPFGKKGDHGRAVLGGRTWKEMPRLARGPITLRRRLSVPANGGAE